MRQYVVYHNTSDYPDKFVVRGIEITINLDRRPVVLFDSELTGNPVDTIEEARSFVPKGYVCLQRSNDDDPVIVEVWL